MFVVFAGLRLNNAWASGTVLRPFLQPESGLSSRRLVSGFKCKLRDSNSRPPYSRPHTLTTRLYTFHSQVVQPLHGNAVHLGYEKNIDFETSDYPRVHVGKEAKVTAETETNFTINCFVHSKLPVKSVTWTKNGRVLTNAFNYTIVNVAHEDAGDYQCTAYNGLAKPGTALLSLEVTDAPVISLPKLATVSEGSNFEVECKTQKLKSNQSDIQWFKNGDPDFMVQGYKLQLLSVSSGDSGNYTCSASYMRDDNLHDANATIEITVSQARNDPVESVIKIPTQVIIDEHQDYRLGCAIPKHESLQSKFRWVRQGITEFSPILQLTNVSHADSGNYTCFATYKDKDMLLNANATVEILVRYRPGPVVSVTLERERFSPGENNTITCLASPPGYPPPIYQWWTSDQVENTSFSIPDSPQRNKLVVHFNVPDFNGYRFNCKVANSLGAGAAGSIELQHQLKPLIIAHPPESIVIASGQTFNLSCRARSRPQPEVAWYKNRKRIGEDRKIFSIANTSGRNGTFMTLTSTLKFLGSERPLLNAVNQLDGGEYACFYENELGYSAKFTQVEIQYPPVIQTEYNETAVKDGRRLQLECKVSANPRPTVTWYEGITEIENDYSTKKYIELADKGK